MNKIISEFFSKPSQSSQQPQPSNSHMINTPMTASVSQSSQPPEQSAKNAY
jgi:hypothetical protein